MNNLIYNMNITGGYRLYVELTDSSRKVRVLLLIPYIQVNTLLGIEKL